MTVLEHALLTESELDAALKALASPQRRAIVRMLAARTDDSPTSCCAPAEVCACKLSEHLGLAASTISHHMSVLREAGLVTSRKDGTWVHYGLRADVLREVAESIRLM